MESKEYLSKKLAEKKALKAELQAKDGVADIEAKVAEYRKQLEMEFNADKEADLARLDIYIKHLKEMIAEIEAEEQAAAEAAAQAAVDPNAPPTVA